MTSQKVFILFAIAAFSLAIVATEQGFDVKMKELLARSSFLKCLGKYSHFMANAKERLNRTSVACNQTCEKEKSEIEAATVQLRDGMSVSASQSCDAINRCNYVPTAAGSLKCVADGGKASSKLFYDASVNASKALRELEESQRVAEAKNKACMNGALYEFHNNTMTGNTILNKCYEDDDDDDDDNDDDATIWPEIDF